MSALIGSLDVYKESTYATTLDSKGNTLKIQTLAFPFSLGINHLSRAR
jgi:hypothetical protein